MLLLACAVPPVAATEVEATTAATAAPTSEVGGLLLLDGHVVGVGVTDLRIVDGVITATGELEPVDGEEVADLTGKWVTPGFIDSHVHLLYLNEPMLLAGGVIARVDMAAPVAIFDADLSPMRVIAAGVDAGCRVSTGWAWRSCDDPGWRVVSARGLA